MTASIGDHVILVNNATLAGHVTVGDHAILGGLCAVHQFVRIGAYAFVGGMSGVENDVIPFGMVLGNRAHLSGLNIVGLKRHGFPREQIHELRQAYRMLFASEGTLMERLEDVEKMFPANPLVRQIVEFINVPFRPLLLRADNNGPTPSQALTRDRSSRRPLPSGEGPLAIIAGGGSMPLHARRSGAGAGPQRAYRRHSRRGRSGHRALFRTPG